MIAAPCPLHHADTTRDPPVSQPRGTCTCATCAPSLAISNTSRASGDLHCCMIIMSAEARLVPLVVPPGPESFPPASSTTRWCSRDYSALQSIPELRGRGLRCWMVLEAGESGLRMARWITVVGCWWWVLGGGRWVVVGGWWEVGDGWWWPSDACACKYLSLYALPRANNTAHQPTSKEPRANK